MDTEVKKFIKDKLTYAIEHEYIKPYNVDVLTFIIYKVYIALMFEWDSEKMPLDEKEISDNVLQVLKNGIINKKGSIV